MMIIIIFKLFTWKYLKFELEEESLELEEEGRQTWLWGDNDENFWRKYEAK